MKTLQGAFLLGVEEGQGFLAGIGEDFLHHKGRGNLVSLICILVGDEPVELGAQDNGLQQRCHHQVEHGILEWGIAGIFLGQERVDVGEVYRLGDVGLVVAAVGIDEGRNKVHGIEIPQQIAVLPVTKPALLFFQISHTFNS